ncbi:MULTISPECIES: maleylpyruvate isomerase family mycothiol-dependent enzyme [Actinosynnema]|uniref:maleylpyruvate isomerase family mycothiol-dependent enzyme n=1 Tax=Actinosynnema TaxID=40566 RepID=UPI0020A33A7E|nr:maleylpyruvate isomerase family mycothiol-dependent enzyme [Actinosynnema pretiosum]MCP2093185.1 TIGR03083 family protein [Actinosynnema pretiosum]
MSRGLLGYGQHIDVVERETALLAVAARGRPELQVPACPGLNLGETARHVGSTQRMVLARVDGSSQWQHEPTPDQDLPTYLLQGLTPLLEALRASDPAEPCDTWSPPRRDIAFWARRLAHEATVHRMDAQAAAGIDLDPVADDLALDGIDEVLSLWLGHRLDVLGVRGTREGSVLLRAGAHAWLARTGPDPATYHLARPGERGDGVVTGTPTALYRWLWGRVPDREVAPRGDRDAIAQLWALLRLATK